MKCLLFYRHSRAVFSFLSSAFLLGFPTFMACHPIPKVGIPVATHTHAQQIQKDIVKIVSSSSMANCTTSQSEDFLNFPIE
jgi:hypothetical protein